MHFVNNAKLGKGKCENGRKFASDVQIEGRFYVERKSIICNSHSGVKNSYTDAEYFTRRKLSLKLCLFSFYAHANLCATQFHAVSL